MIVAYICQENVLSTGGPWDENDRERLERWKNQVNRQSYRLKQSKVKMDLSSYRVLLDFSYHSKRYSKSRIELQDKIVADVTERSKTDYGSSLSDKQW